MKHLEHGRPILLMGTSNREQLVTQIAAQLTQLLDQPIEQELLPYEFFANGECKLELESSTRGKHVYTILDANSHSTDHARVPSFNDRIVFGELLLSEAKRRGAKTINTILPCFPYSRADKPTHYGNKSRPPRVPSSARRMVNQIEHLDTDYCLTLDMHNPATMEIFDETQAIDLPTGRLVEEVIAQLPYDRHLITLSSADEGGAKKIREIAKDLQIAHAIAIKEKDYSSASKVDTIELFGKIENRHVLIHDDMIDTAGTFIKLLEAMQTYHPASIDAVITHPLLNGDALSKLDDAHEQGLFTHLWVTDSVYHHTLPDYMQTISTAGLFADKIVAIAQERSIDYNQTFTPTA